MFAQVALVAIGLGVIVERSIAAGTARAWFGRSPRRVERLGAIGDATMIGLGLQLAISGRTS